jgi:hypothetical protein
VCKHSNALKESKAIEIHVRLCIVHYAFKESSELCIMSMLSSEHVCNVDAKFTHNAQQQCQVLQHLFLQSYKMHTCALK